LCVAAFAPAATVLGMSAPDYIIDQDRVVTFEPVGVTTDFPIPWPVFAADSFVVTVGGAPRTDWTFVGVFDNFTVPNQCTDAVIRFSPGVTGTVVIEGNQRAIRPNSFQFQEGVGIPARNLNAALNMLTAMDRESQRRDKRSVRVPIGETIDPLQPAATRRGKIAVFDPVTGALVAGELIDETRDIVDDLVPIVEGHTVELAQHDARMTAQDERQNESDARDTAQDLRMSGIDSRQDAFEGTQDGFAGTLGEFEDRQDAFDARQDTFDTRLDSVEAGGTTVAGRVATLEDRADDLEAADLGFYALDGSRSLTGDMNAGGNRIGGLAAPTGPSNATNKGYVDATAATLSTAIGNVSDDLDAVADRVTDLEVSDLAVRPRLDKLEGYPAPYTFLPGTDVLAVSIAYDGEGRPLSARVVGDNRTWAPVPGGAWMPEGHSFRPAVYRPGTTEIIRSLVVDAAGAPLSERVQPNGMWAYLEPYAYLSDHADSVAVAVERDQNGGFLRGQVNSHLPLAVDYLASPDGPVRRESVVQDKPVLFQAGPTIVVPPSRMAYAGGYIDTPGGVVTSSEQAPSAVSAEAVQVRYAAPYWLQYQYLRGPTTVTRTSDSVVLTEGVHYEINRDLGTITGLINTADFAVTIAYTGYRQRQEIIWVDVATGQLGITAGATSRSAAGLYPPAVPGRAIPLYRVFRTIRGCDLVPISRYKNRARIEQQGAAAARLLQNRSLLKRFIDKVAVQPVLTIAGTGDSTLAMGVYRDASYTYVPASVLPNGGRDRRSYYAYATSDLTTVGGVSDGNGDLTVETGIAFQLIKYLRSLSNTVNWLNFAIAGTDSSATQLPDGRHNQGHPTLLASINSYKPDLLIYPAGMNDQVRDNIPLLYDRYCAKIASHLAAGVDMLVSTPCRTSITDDRYDIWLQVCGEVLRACEAMGVACVDTTQFFARENLAASGLTEQELAAANRINHPGVPEQRVLGDAFAEIIKG
jgi:hypothetical protein